MNEKISLFDILTGLDTKALADDLDELLAGTPIAPVAYTFANKDDLMANWQIRELLLSEELSQPYRIWLTLVSDQRGHDVQQLLGANCEVTIDRQDVSRTVHGLIRVVESVGVDADRVTIRVEVVPALALLDECVDTRAWQDCSVVDVVREVLEAGLGEYGRELDLKGLCSEYPRRENIVQYHESDLAFVSRLLEEEGIHYSFGHEGRDHEVLRLWDSTDSSEEVLTVNDSPLLYVIADNAEIAEVESVQSFVLARELTATSIYQRIFDWLQPTAPIEVEGPPAADERGHVRAVYHHGRFVEDQPGPRTARKLEHRTQRGSLASGVSNVTGLQPGRRFAIVDPLRPELTRVYILRRVIHEGECPEVTLEASSSKPRYSNQFECQIFDPLNPPRPLPRTKRPKIQGPQTAIVTGPVGEEIYTDEHGRVKVRFDWDRINGLRDDSSIWIRVAQHWAGPGFGSFFVPRIGMEVVVDFLEGDPDKPLIIGCVYNGDNSISVGVPGNKTQSTIRTRSSPASEGFNELRFEDATGCEEVFIHAQRNLRERVLSCHNTSVGANQSNTVGANQTTTVGANQSTSVGANQSNTVSGSQTETISGCQSITVKKTRTKTVTEDETNTLEASRKTTVMCDETLDVHGTTAVTSEGNHSLVCQAETSVWSKTKIALSQDDQASLDISGGALTIATESTYGLTARKSASITSTEGRIDISSASCGVSVFGSSEVKLIQGCASVHLIGDAVTIQASRITLQAGGDKVEVTGSGVTVYSDGPVAVTGSVIKLNC